jgi:hypothetical protein
MYCVNLVEEFSPLRHIRRGLRRVKKDAGNPIPVPQNLQTMEIPEEYTVTHRDEPFLLYDSGIDSPVRILVFSTDTNLRALTTTGHYWVSSILLNSSKTTSDMA